MLTYIKITGAAIVVLLALLGLQHALYRNELKKSATLMQLNRQVVDANAAGRKEICRLMSETKALEATMARAAAEQQQIIETNNARLRATQAALEKLKADHEKVAVWMDVPVPAEFLDWLRACDRKDGNR